MNVYDFDKTIYDGDSSMDFYHYCLLNYPSALNCLFRQAWGICRYVAGRIDTTELKEMFFSFLPQISSLDIVIEKFWDSKQQKIKTWYLAQKCHSDVVISASPSFLLCPICRRLEIMPPIATVMDPATGKIDGINCKGEEKVRRFFETYPNEKIQNFFSDSITDLPLAMLAETAFFVQGDATTSWTFRGKTWR